MIDPSIYKEKPNYHTIKNHLFSLKNKQQNPMVFSIGKSVLGRSILAVGFGNIQQACTLFVGGTHGLEWITTLLLLRLCDDISISLWENKLLKETNVRKLLSIKPFIVVPCLNPDGMEIALHGANAGIYLSQSITEISKGDTSTWQANARGVDLNHNFDAGWDILKQMELAQNITKPAPTRYGGPTHTSEPETIAIMNLCKTFNISKAFSLHSQGEEIYYKYGAHTPPQSHLMAQILADCCGYTLADPETIASHGGFKDWFIDTFHKPGFTFEVGKGKNPLPITDLEPIYEKILDALLIGILL